MMQEAENPLCSTESGVLAVSDIASSSGPEEKEVDGVIFEIPQESSQWSLIPLNEIENLTRDDIISRLYDLTKRYNTPFPEDLDSLSIEEARALLKEVASRPDLKEPQAKKNLDEELRIRIGKPRENNPGPFCRINLNGRILLNYPAIAEYLHKEFHTIAFHPPEGQPHRLFIYDKKTGLYRQNSGDLESVINRILEISEASGSPIKDTKDILHLISSKNRQFSYPFNLQDGSSIGLVPVLNGVCRLDFNAGRVSLIPHSPEHLWTFTLPVRYNPIAPADALIEVMKSWIGEWTDEERQEEKDEEISRPDKWKLLLQIPAQGLLQFIMDKTYKSSYIIVGEPNAGKSSYLTYLLPHFFGSNAVAGESLHKIVSDKFVTAELENKILNVFDDLSDAELGAVGQFKAFTGITRHTITRKHQGGYTGRIFCTHCFACNQPPKVPDSCLYDTAFWDRWTFIRFPFIHKKEPTFLTRLLTEENLSSFLTMTLAMMVSIRQKQALPFQMSVGEVMQLWMQKADPLAQFLEEMMREAAKVQDFDRELLFDAYCKWFDEQNPPIDIRKKIPNLKDFAVALIKYELLSTKTSTKRGGKKFNLTVFKGKYSWIHGQELMQPRIKGLDDFSD